MPLDPKNSDKKIMAGANSRLTFPLPFKPGQKIRMLGKGIFMSLNKAYVMTYYSGLADEEVLVTFRFDPDSLKSGNLTDRETEFSVPVATVVGVERL